jgi:hypothetical protein
MYCQQACTGSAYASSDALATPRPHRRHVLLCWRGVWLQPCGLLPSCWPLAARQPALRVGVLKRLQGGGMHAGMKCVMSRYSSSCCHGQLFFEEVQCAARCRHMLMAAPPTASPLPALPCAEIWPTDTWVDPAPATTRDSCPLGPMLPTTSAAAAMLVHVPPSLTPLTGCELAAGVAMAGAGTLT